MREEQRSWKQVLGIAVKDFDLFASLCVAQFIVWRTLRRQRHNTGAPSGPFRLTIPLSRAHAVRPRESFSFLLEREQMKLSEVLQLSEIASGDN
jgi:hypothetical protein